MVTATKTPRRAWVEQIMGLPISIHLRGDDVRSEATEAVVARVYRRLRWVDSVFSTYRQDSTVSALRRGEVEVDEVVGAVGYIVDVCAEASRVTGGCFSADLPDADGVRRFDPSGVVKGWAIGEAAKLLGELPVHSYCINAGGDIATGYGPDCPREVRDQAWRVGLQSPHRADAIARTVELHTGGLATSGLYARGNHIYDPRTGTYPTTTGSVTVSGPDVMWADIWATALFVGGKESEELLHQWDPRYSVIRLT